MERNAEYANGKKKAVSIKDIAKLCNVSVPTVSRVINNAGGYSAETEQKVRQVIMETGYQPSMLAKGLRTNATQSIGIVVPDITNEFFASITLAIQMTLHEHSFTAMICNTNEQPSIQAQQLEMLRSSRVSGIIFISGEDIADEDLADGIPKVFVDRIPWNAESKGAVTIETDNYMGGRLAAGALLDAGCRRIAGLFDGRGFSTQAARYSGFLRAHQDRGMDAIRELYYPVPQVSVDGGYRAVRMLIESGTEFDGLFCYSDLLAYGAIRALSEAGISVPNQVLVTGYDGTTFSGWGKPSLTTVEQPVAEMGRLAAEIVLKMSKHEQLEQKHFKLSVRLVQRDSTKRKP